MLNFVALWRRQNVTVRELSRLSDRELADVGIPREELKAAARRAATAAAGGIPAAASSIAARDIDPVETMAPAWGARNRRAATA